jgi:hypothetical protein
MSLEIKTADELVDRELEARWTERRQGPAGELLRSVLRAFADRGGPIPASEIGATFPERSSKAIREELAMLDEKDLILLEEDEIRLAYPFSAKPTEFLVTLTHDRERFACCAVDALGIAAMLGERVVIRSRCHECGEPLELTVDGRGPLKPGEVMVWVGKRAADERRVCNTL